MADFRQLALEFVLADDEKTLTRLSQTAATGMPWQSTLYSAL